MNGFRGEEKKIYGRRKDQSGENKDVLSTLSVIFFHVTVLVAVVLLVSLYVLPNVTISKKRTEENFTLVRNYTCREIQEDKAPIGVIKEYTFPVSEALDNDTHLAFYTVHQYVAVYLDGALVYSLKPSEGLFSRTVGSNWTMIPLYTSDAGKEIRVEITPVYESFRNRQVDFLIGSRLAIYTDRLQKDLPQLVLSVIAALVGMAFFCVANFSTIGRSGNEELASLGIFSIMMGLWRFTDTRFTPFIAPKRPTFLFYVSVIMLMVGIVPLIKSLEHKFHPVSRHILDASCIVTALISLIQLLLQLFGIVDLREGLFLVHIMIVVDMVMIVGNAVYDRSRHPEKYTNVAEKGLPYILLAGIMGDVIAYYVKGNSSGLLFSLLAMVIYTILSGIIMMYRYVRRGKQLAEKERELAETERQLTENRIAIMMSQIQPHFIYNTLGTIGQFCREDPDRAADLVQKFSLYLRGNFTELDNAAPIRFSQEMEHVRHYVDIERIRFPDMQVQYELQEEEFLLPALTVQPLVENAIKHGLMGLESGGTVVVSSWKTESDYCVSVKDDGVGFAESVFQDGKKHIGIKNIRGRIEAMCGGTLTIDSTPGTGTTAVLTIPRERKEP